MKTLTENILNVTVIEPRLKHPTIFSRFDELKEGESLTIMNDHDPKPLYYQLLGERGNIFTWEYLENGPRSWKVRITKNGLGASNETLGEIAAKDLRKAQVFKKYGLDFCCGGKKTVKEACAEKGLDVGLIEKALQQTENNSTSSKPLPYDEWELGFLADYIVNTHHAYVRKNLPDIRAYADKVRKVHADNHPELVKVHALVESLAGELIPHMLKEEQVLFPHIRQFVSAKNNPVYDNTLAPASIKQPVAVMKHDHEVVHKLADELREATSDYTIPADACASYSLLYRMLDEFEDDLHTHLHLENNILFPKAEALESNQVN